MAGSPVRTFDQALERAAEFSPRHVLLGNGFSMAYDPTAFNYVKLLDDADFSDLSVDMRRVFENFGTSDFEKIIEFLRAAAQLVEMYESVDSELAGRFAADADALRAALAGVLARLHPDHVGMLSDEQYRSVRQFLSHFKRIYTLNYDLLLYWATMREVGPSIPRNDGFGEDPDDPGREWVVWRDTRDFDQQRIFYLHGALHLFDGGDELRKLTWCRTDIRLIDQIRGALDEALYPLVVTEGTSEEKKSKILHHAYLMHALRSFSRIQGAVFVYGCALSDNDDHILREIVHGKLKAMFVGLYGDPDSTDNRSIRTRAEAVAGGRDHRNPLRVEFFDAESANVWGSA